MDGMVYIILANVCLFYKTYVSAYIFIYEMLDFEGLRAFELNL